jgi:protein-S-isoprenylcysteine O-methyltransferase Ste14
MSTPDPSALAALAAAWSLYFCLHSLLASSRLKALVSTRCPRFASGYRIAYNAVALVALAPVLWLQWRLAGPPLAEWPPALRTAADLAALAALGAFVWTLRWYDLRSFAGLRAEVPGDAAGFVLSPLHRHVRHPWYFLALVVIWTRPMDAAWLVASVAITAYLVVGSRLEERKLVEVFGDAYARYRERVPGLWPWPGRSLSAAEAAGWVQRWRAAPDLSRADQ